MSERLEEAMKAKGITSKQLASLIGVSDRAVELWLKGKRQPNASSLKKICLTLGVSADDMLGIRIAN